MGLALDVASYASESAPEVIEHLVNPPAPRGASAGSKDTVYPLMRRYGAYRRQLRFQAAAHSNRCHTYCVSPGMLMAVVDVGCRGPFESPVSGQDIVEFHYRLAGSIALAGSWGELQLRDPSCLLWYQPAGCDDVAERMGPGQFTQVPQHRESWISLYCDRTWLARVGGPAAAINVLCELPHERATRTAPIFRVSSPDAKTLRIAHDIFEIEGRSAIDCLLAVAKAHELLAWTLSRMRFAVARPRAVRGPGGAERRSANLARDILIRELLQPPALAELARRVGVNRFRIGAVFKQEFGESVFDFVRRRRLELAAELVRASSLQMREIALRAGYRHHSTFTAAFTRYFGLTPKQVRRSARIPGGI